MSTQMSARLLCPGSAVLHGSCGRKSGVPGAVVPACPAGRVDIVLPPQLLHRRRWAAFGTVTVSGKGVDGPRRCGTTPRRDG